MQEIKSKLGHTDLSKTLLLGDRLETDILIGKLGIDTALVSTGM